MRQTVGILLTYHVLVSYLLQAQVLCRYLHVNFFPASVDEPVRSDARTHGRIHSLSDTHGTRLSRWHQTDFIFIFLFFLFVLTCLICIVCSPLVVVFAFILVVSLASFFVFFLSILVLCAR